MIWEGRPFSGRELEKLKQFLKKMDLEYDDGIEYSICILNDEYEIIGTGSVDQNVIKCVAIDPNYQGQGNSATILTSLIQYEFEKSRTHIFIYTKPKNLPMFADMGFHTIMQTSDVLFMENQPQGFANFLKNLRNETPEDALEKERMIGAIVANCNPFTVEHLYLVEHASSCCDYVHLFVLSDNRNFFSANDRYQMVKLGIQGLNNVIFHRTSDYIISAATFPTYFFKDQMQGKEANCQLDLEIFGSKIAPTLGISRRFVGTEPFCKVTDSYNCAMKKILPAYGIEVEEILRKTNGEAPVSASAVRNYLTNGEYQKVRTLVPKSVYEYLMNHFNADSKVRSYISFRIKPCDDHMHDIRDQYDRYRQIRKDTVCFLNQCQQSELRDSEIHNTTDNRSYDFFSGNLKSALVRTGPLFLHCL